ncbi:MAG: penicillin-binding transpeptidase domain-containing protein [Hominisplanchenecus sp.]
MPEALGISTLYDDENLDVRQPLALGGITDGVVNIELCDAYATIANGGKYNEAKFYSRIEDSEGKVIIDNTPEEKTVLKDSTAFLLTQAMMDVVKAGGTASDVSLGEMPIAGKTGTTSDDRDIWFAAYSPYYTCTVWGGYDNHDTLPSGDLYHTYHKKLWTAIMSRIHENLPVRQFEQPDSVETAYVCKKSGLLAVDGVCTGDPRGSMAYTEYFAKGTTPTKSCDVHTAVKVCSSTGLLPTATCTTTTKIFVKRPAGSEGTTEDSAYAPPSATCKGHNILDKITDILNPKKDAADMDADDSKKDGAITPGSDANSGSTTTPDSNSGSGDSSGSGGTGSGTGSGSGGSTSDGGSGGDSGGTTAPGGDDILEIIP